MPNDMARQCAKEQDIDTLFRHDQLNLSMESSAVFAGYTE